MKKRLMFLFLVLLLAVGAMPALAADPNPPAPPSRFVLWGTVTAINAANHTFNVHVVIYRGNHGAPPTTARPAPSQTGGAWAMVWRWSIGPSNASA